MIRSNDYELIQSIANDLALNNHLLEYYKSLFLDYDDNTEKTAILKTQLYELIFSVQNIRREKMKALLISDSKMWCAIKHAIESDMQVTEYWLASPTQDKENLMHETFHNLLLTLKIATGKDLIICERCTNDEEPDNGLPM